MLQPRRLRLAHVEWESDPNRCSSQWMKEAVMAPPDVGVRSKAQYHQKKLELEREKLEIEREKLELERTKAQWTAGSILISALVAVLAYTKPS